jgi:hypothetical protein
MDLATESRLIVLMRDLEGLCAKLNAALSGVAHEAKQVAIAARDLDLEQELRPELSYRLEQWDGESLARTVCATSSLSIALAAWQEAIKLDPRSTWSLRQGTHVLKQHEPSASKD